jgi:cobyrinic acid a,c-diamide synthase
VQAFKKGPDYIDPLWLNMASGRPCYNLDFHTQGHDELALFFRDHCHSADHALIEGNLGLYDGMDLQGSDSNAAMAKLLGAPVVLIINSRGVTRGVAPLLQGYQAFDQDVNIAGVIFNQVGGSRQEKRLREVVEHYTDIPVLGMVAHNPKLLIEERHLGLVPGNEDADAAATIQALAHAVAEGVDLDNLLSVSQPMPTPFGGALPNEPLSPTVTIGVARDSAFGFYYPDDLEAMERAGARLIFFSPLNDACIPDVDGLFFGGGFPETHLDALTANSAMRTSVKSFIEAGGVVYAECGGMMYLCKTLQWQGRRVEMVGAIAADAVMYPRPQGRGYMRLVERENHPWSGTRPGEVIGVHEFHYSRLENLEGDLSYAYDLARGVGIDGRHDGLIYKNLLAGYAHQRNCGDNRWVQRFVDHVVQCRMRG